MMRQNSLSPHALLVFVASFAVLFVGTAEAQHKMLWQGAVKPNRINVYGQPSTHESVARTLGHGDVVDAVLEVRVLDSAWCRIALPNEPEPIGYVLCFNLQQGKFTTQEKNQSESVVDASANTSSSQPTLTNKDVVDMNKAGLSSDVVIASIKSSRCSFDMSPSQLQQLKSNGVPDAVGLAMVQTRVAKSETPAVPQPNPVAKEPSGPATASDVAPESSHQSSGGPCVILKRMGPADQITSHLYAFGIRGKQFQYVEGELPHGVSFHGRLTDHDVRNIQEKGGRVQVLEPKFSVADLQEARKGCRQ